MRGLIKFIASFFYLGYLPWFPGTWGSLGALAIVIALNERWHLYLPAMLTLIIAGFIVSSRAEKLYGQHDEQKIVIDEAAGLFLAFFLIPLQPVYLLTGFILFRFLDITKPALLRKAENLPGGWGVMGDDILAGALTNILLHLLKVFI